MKPKILEECRKKLYDAIWLEVDQDPQRPAAARVSVETPAGRIHIWSDKTGNVATVKHNGNDHESERLVEAIEGCINYEDVRDDYFDECPEVEDFDTDPLDAYNDWRLDCMMNEFSR